MEENQKKVPPFWENTLKSNQFGEICNLSNQSPGSIFGVTACHNAFTIVITILQPMLWLVLYSAVAGQSMKGIGVANYTAFSSKAVMLLER